VPDGDEKDLVCEECGRSPDKDQNPDDDWRA
jgi:hypothetical protein